MIKIDETEKTLKLFQYSQVCLLDNNYHFIKVYSDIYYRNNQVKIFGLNNIEFAFVDVDYKAGGI